MSLYDVVENLGCGGFSLFVGCFVAMWGACRLWVVCCGPGGTEERPAGVTPHPRAGLACWNPQRSKKRMSTRFRQTPAAPLFGAGCAWAFGLTAGGRATTGKSPTPALEALFLGL